MTPGTKNMTAGCTVAAGFARGLMELAVTRGASREVLAERCGIRRADLDDPDRRIPIAQYVALMRAGQALCNDPALALHFGEMFDVFETSIVGLIGRSCETMADAFVQMNRFGRLVVEVDLRIADRYQLERARDGLWIIDTRQSPNEFPELTESSFARMVCAGRRYGTPQFVTAVHVTHTAPAYRAEYERIFQMPVVFESDRNALLTDEAWLTHPPAPPSSAPLPRYAFGILSAHAEALLASLESSKSTRGRVENLLIPILHTGEAKMETIASTLGLSRQTLFRRLKTEGVTFETVLDELRHTMALHYLRGKNTSVNETAYLLGFSEPAAFSRAFRRWTGSNPRQQKVAHRS
jgi:AraC-like DNA-binding protein